MDQTISIRRNSNVVRFCNANDYVLGYDIVEIFGTDGKDVLKAVRKLKKEKIYVLGQLIQLSKDEILQFPFMETDIFEKMETRLRDFALEFNSSLPRWNKGMPDLLVPILKVYAKSSRLAHEIG